MRLTKMHLKGFQSFQDTGPLEFYAGMNLIIGQNNVGKSALLRSLVWPLRDDRHRSKKNWKSHRLTAPQIDIDLSITGDEMADAVFMRGRLQTTIRSQAEGAIRQVASHLFDGNHEIPIRRMPNSEMIPRDVSHGLYEMAPDAVSHAKILFVTHRGVIDVEGVQIGGNDEFPAMIREMYDRSVFYFSAQRLTVGKHSHARADRLSPNASNLPAVLHTLAGSRGSIFRQIIDHTKTIFPGTVGNISISPVENEVANEIRIWPSEDQDEFELSFALEDSGTGVSQVIAILTAVSTVKNSVIIIDEINSFMHPSAVKSLLRILTTYYSDHQYIISTHSPEVISFGSPAVVYMVTRDGYDSSVQKIMLDDIVQLQSMADHIGISMGDVFAAERIIWVEGPTEEICFPYVLEKFGGSLPNGTTMISVVATGDFGPKQRNKKLIYDIYKRLTSATKSLVKSVSFSFDSEGLTPRQKSDMSKEAEGSVFFLPRRLFECYLIDEFAIAEFIRERDSESSWVSDGHVKKKLIEYGHDFTPKEFSWDDDIENSNWLEIVDAARLISKVVEEISENRLLFRKKGDAFNILQKIMNRKPEKLQSLAEYLKKIVAFSDK